MRLSDAQHRTLANMRDGGTLIRVMYLFGSTRSNILLHDEELMRYNRARIPYTTLDSMVRKGVIEFDHSETKYHHTYKYYRISAVGIAALASYGAKRERR